METCEVKVRIPTGLKERLAKRAASNNRSISSEVVTVVDGAMNGAENDVIFTITVHGGGGCRVKMACGATWSNGSVRTAEKMARDFVAAMKRNQGKTYFDRNPVTP